MVRSGFEGEEERDRIFGCELRFVFGRGETVAGVVVVVAANR